MNEFILHENDYLEPFDELQAIIDTRQNTTIRKELTNISDRLKFAIIELVQQRDNYISDTAKFKELYLNEKDFAKYASLEGGFNPNFLWNMFLSRQATEQAIKQVNKTFTDGIKIQKAWRKAK